MKIESTRKLEKEEITFFYFLLFHLGGKSNELRCAQFELNKAVMFHQYDLIMMAHLKQKQLHIL